MARFYIQKPIGPITAGNKQVNFWTDDFEVSETKAKKIIEQKVREIGPEMEESEIQKGIALVVQSLENKTSVILGDLCIRSLRGDTPKKVIKAEREKEESNG